MNRLLCILNNMDVGGAETFLMKIFRFIDRSKYMFDFCLCSDHKSFYEDEIKELGGSVFHISSKTNNLSLFKKQLFELVRANSYKYVLRITANAMGTMDLKICKKAGATVCCVRSSNSSDEGGLKMKILNWFGRKLYLKYSDVRIAPSIEAGHYTFGKNAPFSIVRNGINYSDYSFDFEKRKVIRTQLRLQPNSFVVGHIGRFNLQKNHAFIFRLFEELYKINNNSVLLLIGQGPLMQHFQTAIADKPFCNNVIFAGQQSDIKAFLSAMDCFVFPSLFEGTPNTVIEAQANGLNCFVSDSITKDAKIASNCFYLPITNTYQWLHLINTTPLIRTENADMFKKNHYCLDESVKDFIDIIFTK